MDHLEFVPRTTYYKIDIMIKSKSDSKSFCNTEVC